MEQEKEASERAFVDSVDFVFVSSYDILRR
jgi:hypothetical protein